MNILYLHQYFSTRSGFTGTRSYEFATRLVRRGHRVTMVTSGRHSAPALTVPNGQSYFQTEVDGINVVPIDAAYNDPLHGTAMGGVARMRAFLHFARLATRVGKRLPRPDVVFATHTPLTIGLAGMKIARHFRVPFVFEVRDLWPDALVNAGTLGNPVVIWWLNRMARRIYRAAAHVVALSPGMKAGVVRAGVPTERVSVIPNGSDLDLFRPDLDGSAARRRLGWGERFVALYFGAMGRANGLEYAIEAARILRDRGDERILVVLLGQGGTRPGLEELVRTYRLGNVTFHDPVPKAQLSEIVAASDVCLTIFAGTRREQSWSPNKLFDALAAGKPVLINVPGWLRELVEGNGCGRYVDPDDPPALADALATLAEDRASGTRMGHNARALAEREFGRDHLTDRLEEVLRKAVETGPPPVGVAKHVHDGERPVRTG